VGKLLSIETGFTCNSRCQYCTQLDYRAIPQADQLDLTTEQIQARIIWAKDNGHDELGFSGGEPTIRPDFLDLLAFARDTGFERIAVTTNGRMFAYPKFADQAIANGLTRFTFSLHGATPELHDKIAVAPGALQQALMGLDNIAAAAKRQGVKLHLMNNQILLPENTKHIKDMVALLAPKGVRLFMIQPFIAQRSNVADLGRWFVPYDDVVAAVQEALPVLAQYGARIKPYNVPNCLLTPFGHEYVEPQFYPISVFREFEQENAGEFKPFKARQWFRVDACQTCKEVCPGFRIEQLPQDKMADAVVTAGEVFRTNADLPLIIGGTELLAPQTLADTLARLAPVALLTAASERTTRPQLAELVVEAHANGHLTELLLLAQPMDQRFLVQRVLEKGNLEHIRELLLRLADQRERGRSLPKLRLLLGIPDLLRLLDDPVLAGQWPLLVKTLLRAAGDDVAELLLVMPNFAAGHEPPGVVRQAQENIAMMQRLVQTARDAGLQPKLVTLSAERRQVDAVRGDAMQILEQQLASVVAAESWDERLFRHALADGPMEFVTWLPAWLIERTDRPQRHAEPDGQRGGSLTNAKNLTLASGRAG
jgi:MoaA/NifB/PqqE/SkfB family radical SAM enzyme